MQPRPLGRSGLNVAPLMIGGNVFGWTADKAATFAVLDAFVGAGVNGVDTANSYSSWAAGNKGGESETLIGEWLKHSGKRNSVVIATKVGWRFGDEGGLSGKYIKVAAEASLRRLGVDHIDLYQAHIDDADTPQEETMEAFAALVAQGKVRALGASQLSLERIKSAQAIAKANNWPRYETVQPEYSLVARSGFEGPLQNFILAEGMGAITFFALASGFLSGKYRTKADLQGRARGGRAEKYMTAQGLNVLAALDDVAAQTRAKPAQVALAWIMAKPGIVAPISSATNVEQARELAGALEIQLTPAQIAALDEASAVAP